jgi:UDP-N-acetylmuramate-alanine ligase
MNLNQIQNVYFIGIGGIGMSALARYFKISENEFQVMIKHLRL